MTAWLPACRCGEPAREVAGFTGQPCRPSTGRVQVWPPAGEVTKALSALDRRGRLAGVAAALWGSWVGVA